MNVLISAPTIMKSVLTSVDIKENKMNKGRLRYGPTRLVDGRHECIFIQRFL